ncbi:MAG: hypothetical protein ACKV2V_01470 [Blastocatellia bacterium]
MEFFLTLLNPFLWLFLLWPLVTLARREFAPGRRARLWEGLVLYVIAGWLLAYLTVWWHFDQVAGWIVEAAENRDAARKKLQWQGVSALFFASMLGWLAAMLWFVICLPTVHLWKPLAMRYYRDRRVR